MEIKKDDARYPKLLKKIGKEAPKQLYYKGEWQEEIFENCLAVVGSRRMTNYGKTAIEKIVGEAAMAGLTIVSGFMYGCDSQAHKTALKFGGRTIAVMPCGIDLVSPEYQQDLYNEILEQNGLVVSEYSGDFQPALWTYPRRNRIVAGLSRAVLVIEAAKKSGSLITAEWAKKFGRKVFVVPGPITSENSKGIMQLMKQGAEPVSSAEEILQYYKLQIPISLPAQAGKFQLNSNSQIPNHSPSSDGLTPALLKKGGGSKTPVEQRILDVLRLEALGADDLARTFGLSAGELGVVLSTMELKGQIKQEGGKYCLN